ncbi:MAG: hypothetical protein V1752_00375, partial [Candidatus Firestonebacteria bacterium]
YAVNIAGFDLGVTGKYIAMTIKTTATTFAFDGGLIKKFYISGVNAALALTGRNFGFPVSFGSVTETLPRSVNLGLAFEFGRDFILSGEASFPWDNKLFYMTGAEYTIRAQNDLNFKIRSGYNTRSAESGELGGFAVGLGLGNSEYSMDYAFVPLGSLGYTHRMSFSVAFGKGEYFPEQTKKYILNEGAAKRKEVEALKEQKQEAAVEGTAPGKNSIIKESSKPDGFAEFVKKTLEGSKKASSLGAEKMKGSKTEENRKAPVLESLGAEKMRGSKTEEDRKAPVLESLGAEKMKDSKTEEDRKAPVLESLGAEKMKDSKAEARGFYNKGLIFYTNEEYLKSIDMFEKALFAEKNYNSAKYYIEKAVKSQIEVYEKAGKSDEIQKLRKRFNNIQGH